MNPNPSTPTPDHPWKNPAPARTLERARQLREGTRALRLACQQGRGGGAGTLQGFHVTHLLVYEGAQVARVYRYLGVYYTLEQWTHGEPGLRKTDLREGESFAKV